MASTALETVTEFVQEALEGSEAAALKGVTILWGPPPGDDRPGTFVSVGFGPDGQSGESERQFKLIGGQKIDEAITLELMVEVLEVGGGTNLKAAYSSSLTVAAAVETVIREDLSLGDALIEPALLSNWRGRYFRADKARGHRVFLTLKGTARI